DTSLPPVKIRSTPNDKVLRTAVMRLWSRLIEYVLLQPARATFCNEYVDTDIFCQAENWLLPNDGRNLNIILEYKTITGRGYFSNQMITIFISIYR
ncbi:hypothetical protein, partial [Klebsiella grimontii]|uniref:hypothetical protein n=1 Tax=Klebsiella grimontii TaxID=2058152 RepID=UPI001C497E15